MKQKKFTIIKKVAKHGRQSIIVIPRIIQDELQPGTIAQITIKPIKREGKKNEN